MPACRERGETRILNHGGHSRYRRGTRDPYFYDRDPHPAIAAGNATLHEAGDWYLRRVLARTGGNYTETARILAVDRSTVRRRAS